MISLKLAPGGAAWLQDNVQQCEDGDDEGCPGREGCWRKRGLQPLK